MISEGKLNLNDTLQHHLPNTGILYDIDDEITIYHMLHHISNINEYLGFIFDTGYFDMYFSPEELI